MSMRLLYHPIWLHPESFGETWDHYWAVQANPLGLAFLNFLLLKIVYLPDSEWSFRLTSFLQSKFSLVHTKIYEYLTESKASTTSYIALAFMPLLWVYVVGIMPTYLPSHFFISVYLLTKSRRIDRFLFASSLTYILSMLVKFHMGVLAFGIVYLILHQNDYKIDDCI